MTSPGGDSRQVKIVVAADVAAAIRGLGQVADAAGNVGGSADDAGKKTNGWVDAFKTGIGVLGVSTGWDAIKSGFDKVISSGLDFEGSMNTLSAVTNANTDEMKALGDRAKQLGNDITIPGASAGTAAAAMAELAKGGLKIDETMTAASGTLRLAAAAQIDGAEAAQIQANALNAFRLNADQADHVADVLANSANAASGEITDMASALQQSATVAAGFGISVDDSATTLALFAKNGVLGSDAGTSFKTMLTALASPTDAQAAALDQLNLKVYDASGNFVGMESVTKQLAAAHQRLTTEQYNSAASTAFGTDAIRAANILGTEGTQGWKDMATAVSQAGGAQDLAAAQSQGLNGALDRLDNSISNTALTLYEKLAPALSGVADFGAAAFSWLGDAIGWFSDLPDPVRNAALALGAVVVLRGPLGAIGPAISRMVGMAVLNFNALVVAVRSSTFSMATLGTVAKTALGALGGPIGLAIVGVTAALSLFSGSSDDATQSTEGLNEAIDEQTGKLKGNAAQIIATEAANSGASAAYERLGGNVSDYVDALGGVPGKQELVNKVISDARAAYDAQQAAIQAASQGTAGFTGAQVAAGAAAGAAVPAIGDLNAATGYLASAQGTLTEKTDEVRLANEGATGALGATAGAADGAAGAAAGAAERMKAFSDQLKTAQDNAQLLADNTALAQYLGAAKQSADDANRSMSYFKELQDELTGHTRSYNDAVAAQNGNLANLKKAFDDGTKAATENTEAGNLNIDALNNWQVSTLTATSDGRTMYEALTRLSDGHLETANAAYQNAIAQGQTLPEAMASGRAEADENRKSFIELATQYNGGNTDAAVALADKLGILAGAQIEDKNFQVVADDQQAQDALRNAQAAVIADKTFKITALAGVDQATMDNANAKAAAFGYATTDYSAILQGKADGGWVSGPGGPREDMVHARLSPGEFVVNAASAGKHGALLEAINSGAMGFADGGSVPGGDTSATAGAAVAVSAPDPSLFQAAWAAIADAVQAAWTSTLLPVMDAMSARNVQAGAEITTLAATIQSQQSGVIQPTYDALNAGTAGVAAQQELLRATWDVAWQANLDKTTFVGASLTGALFPSLVAGLVNLGVSQQNLAATTDASWSQIGERIQSTYDGQIVPAWDGVQNFAREVESFFTSMQSNVGSATSEITGDVADIKGALVDFFTTVDARIPAHADGGLIDGGAHADGGPITVGTGPRTDDVLVRVSRGEYIVNAASTAKYRPQIEAINNGTAAFADGGLIGDGVKGQMVSGSQQTVGDSVMKALAALTSSVNVAGYNGSQDPSSFGWARATGIVPFSWQGNPILGGVAAGTEGVWTSLLNALVPQIPGGLTEAMYGFENRDNVNSPGVASFHAYGLATDINAGANPNGVPVDARSGPGVIPAGPAREIAAKLGMLWGGDFGGTPDSMHFELHVPPSAIGALGSGASAASSVPLGAGWKQGILDAIKKAKEAALAPPVFAGAGGAPGASSAGVDQWTDVINQALTLTGQPLSMAPYIKNQMRTESSGRADAINLTDSNAQRGIPSKGLMQVIDPTFRAYALPGYNTNIYDPLSNIVASIRYVLDRYGSIPAGMRGVAYDNGGILPPGFTMAYNGTGQNEAIFTGQQFNAMAAQAVGSQKPMRVEIAFRGDGVITQAMVDTATVTVNGAFVELASSVRTMAVQTT